MTTAARAPLGIRERLVLEGERLIAAHGLQAVSLRQVAMAAGTSVTNGSQWA